MDKGITTALAFRTVIYVVLILFFGLISSNNRLMLQMLGVDLSFAILPLAVASTIIYMVALADVLVKGEFWAYVLRGTLGFAVGLFLSSIILAFPYSTEVQPLGFWLFAATVVAVVAYVSRALFESDHVIVLKVLSVSVALLILGFISSQMIDILSQTNAVTFPPSFDIVMFCSFATASALCLIGLLSGLKNRYLSYVGKELSKLSSLAAILVLAVLLFLYSFDLRPILAASYLVYLLPFEWGAVFVISFAIYRNARSYVAKSLAQDLELGKWARLVQKIEHKKDRVEEVSGIVRKFVEEGSKEEVLVYLFSTLLENQASASETAGVTHGIIDYHDIPRSRLILFSRLENHERENKARRKKVLHQTLVDTANVLRLHIPPSRWLEFQIMEDHA
jgi:hypothetical protein